MHPVLLNSSRIMSLFIWRPLPVSWLIWFRSFSDWCSAYCWKWLYSKGLVLHWYICDICCKPNSRKSVEIQACCERHGCRRLITDHVFFFFFMNGRVSTILPIMTDSQATSTAQEIRLQSSHYAKFAQNTHKYWISANSHWDFILFCETFFNSERTEICFASYWENIGIAVVSFGNSCFSFSTNHPDKLSKNCRGINQKCQVCVENVSLEKCQE